MSEPDDSMNAFRIPSPAKFTASPLRQRQPRIKDEAHCTWIRSLPCLVTGQRPAECAHIRFGDLRYGKPQTGLGQRPSDIWAVPLLPSLHRLDKDSQHSGGELAFWQKHHIDPCIVALALWAHSGDDEAAMHILRAARTRQ